MDRIPCTPRPDWQERIAKDGIVFSDVHMPDGTVRSYWRENGYYKLGIAEVLELENHAVNIFQMLVDAGDYIASLPEAGRRAFLRDKMRIPEVAHKATLDTWNEEPACQSVYGRFDLRYSRPGSIPQLYEYNAQTATCLPEAAYAQWNWNADTTYGYDQWNSIWEKLKVAWERNLAEIGTKLGYNPDADPSEKPTIHFAYSSGEQSGEDEMNTSYLSDACREAGYNIRKILVENIKLGEDGRFYTPAAGHEAQETEFEAGELEHLDVCFLLFPWEMIWEADPEWVSALYADMENVGEGGTVWFEAPYKMLWSNKAILPVLWQLFGNDPAKSQYLIPAWFKGEEPADLQDWVEKPVFAREGANIRIFRNGQLACETEGDYASDDPHDYIVQAYAPPPVFHDENLQEVHAICGVWMIDGEPAGLGIREDDTEVTTNLGSFVPHTIGA